MAALPPFLIFFPAAGASSRMRGEDKLLREIAGEPLLRRQVRRALAAGGPVWVSIPAADHPRLNALAGLEVTALPVPDAAEGMAASLRALGRAIPDTCRVLIALPDMPDIETPDFTALRAESDNHPEAILRATAQDGTPGHPVVFPADLVQCFGQLEGDNGARAILAANTHRLRPLRLAGTRALIDLDTPEAWDEWQATNAPQK